MTIPFDCYNRIEVATPSSHARTQSFVDYVVLKGFEIPPSLPHICKITLNCGEPGTCM